MSNILEYSSAYLISLLSSNGIPSSTSFPFLKPQEIILLLIPALAIDSKGNRLGYGGGFFDRLRAKPHWKQIPALAVLPKDCVSRTFLPTDSWDIPLDGWIDEEGLTEIKGLGDLRKKTIENID